MLVRYITQDDVAQSRIATRFIENECSSDSPGVVCGVVLCELVWVLEGVYDQDRKSISTVLEHILKSSQLHVEHSEVIWRVLHAYHHSGVDFSDAYIAELNSMAACKYTVTFDKKACRLKLFKLLS